MWEAGPVLQGPFRNQFNPPGVRLHHAEIAMSFMSLDPFDSLGRMASRLRPRARHAHRDFSRDIVALRRDVATLAEIVRRNGAAPLALGGELAHLTGRSGARALRELERRVETTGRGIGRRPVPALALLGGLLVVGLLLSRRR
jgi:hypothetical protein